MVSAIFDLALITSSIGLSILVSRLAVERMLRLARMTGPRPTTRDLHTR